MTITTTRGALFILLVLAVVLLLLGGATIAPIYAGVPSHPFKNRRETGAHLVKNSTREKGGQ